MKKLTLFGATFLVAFGLTFAIAQTIGQSALSGKECWNAGQGPGGPALGFVCSNVVRDGRAIAVTSGSGAATYAMTNLEDVVYWTGTAPTTWAVTLPAYPFDGEVARLSTDTTLTTMVTVTAGTGGTMNASYAAQTLTADTFVEWIFMASTGKWYRMQ